MTDNLELNMNAYLPLRDVVFNTLREAILKGELKPGERLMELQLASKLGVSRTPIREAIRMLEQEGLAVTVPRKGAEVARMTEKDMEDVLQIRAALDELAVQLATEQITDEQFDALEQARQFSTVTKIDGIILTKLDGTAKGGIAIAIQSELSVPVKYIGVGEQIDDLQKFDPESYVNALFADMDTRSDIEILVPDEE